MAGLHSNVNTPALFTPLFSRYYRYSHTPSHFRSHVCFSWCFVCCCHSQSPTHIIHMAHFTCIHSAHSAHTPHTYWPVSQSVGPVRSASPVSHSQIVSSIFLVLSSPLCRRARCFGATRSITGTRVRTHDPPCRRHICELRERLAQYPSHVKTDYL